MRSMFCSVESETADIAASGGWVASEIQKAACLPPASLPQCGSPDGEPPALPIRVASHKLRRERSEIPRNLFSLRLHHPLGYEQRPSLEVPPMHHPCAVLWDCGPLANHIREVNRAAYELCGRAVLTRAEVLEAASSKLIEAALLLLVAGEDHLATEVEEITERVDPSALVPPLEEPVYPPLRLSDKCT